MSILQETYNTVQMANVAMSVLTREVVRVAASIHRSQAFFELNFLDH